MHLGWSYICSSFSALWKGLLMLSSLTVPKHSPGGQTAAYCEVQRGWMYCRHQFHCCGIQYLSSTACTAIILAATAGKRGPWCVCTFCSEAWTSLQVHCQPDLCTSVSVACSAATIERDALYTVITYLSAVKNTLLPEGGV
jgi:hypothetical protein